MEKTESDTERRRRRANWPVRVRRLEDPDGNNLSASTTAEERLAMMWPLAVEAFSLAGQYGPELARSEWPVRVIRLRDK